MVGGATLLTFPTEKPDGSDRSTLGVEDIRRKLRRCGPPIPPAPARQGAGERRAVPAFAELRRQRQDPRPAHGHQSAGAGEPRWPRAVATGHEGEVPAPRSRGCERVRRPPRGTAVAPRRLYPGADTGGVGAPLA